MRVNNYMMHSAFWGGTICKDDCFVVRNGARGSGRIHAAAQRYGYDQLILQALRIKLRYPLGCADIDRYIERLMLDREYSTKYYFTDLFDPAAVTFRK